MVAPKLTRIPAHATLRGSGRFRAPLTRSGTVAAAVIGAAALWAGPELAIILVWYFLLATAISRLGRSRRDARTAGTVAKGGARDAWQVIANGGIFAALAVATGFFHTRWLELGAMAALAASAADTWATEVGTAFGTTPRSIVTGKPMAPGMSGGITLTGTLAGIAAAVCVVLPSGIIGLTFSGMNGWVMLTGDLCFKLPEQRLQFMNYYMLFLVIPVGGGVAGMLADSLLGALIQERRWCDRCTTSTEQLTHSCGAPTRQTGGIAKLRNDAVNALATAIGASVAILLGLTQHFWMR